MRSKNTKGMVILLLFFAATLANAAPTMCEHNRSLDAFALSTNSDAHTHTKLETIFVTGPVNPHLTTVAAELNKPPVYFSSSQAPAAGIKSLPQIPRAILMVLTGFICVSLVRDRKTWLTVLIGLLWVGQAGFNVLPQLASHLISKKQIEKRDSTNVTNICQPEYSHRLRSDIEGTYYIGLLHHLAGIPEAEESFLKIQEPGLATQFCQRLIHPNTSIQTPRSSESSAFVQAQLRQEQPSSRGIHLSAIIKIPSFLNRLTNCLDTNTEQSIYILSQFVLTALIRGPPNLA